MKKLIAGLILVVIGSTLSAQDIPTLTPVITDINDFMQSHLIGLSFTRAWCLKGIAAELPDGHPWKKRFANAATKFLRNGLPLVFAGNYGGDHWLATFAVYALENS